MSTGFKTKGGLEIREGHWCWVSRKFSESCSSIVKSPGLHPQQVAGLFRKEIYSTVTLLQYFLTSSWCYLYTHITWFIFLDEWGSGSSFKKFCWIHFSEAQFVSVYVLHACQMYNLKIFTRNIHPCKQRHHLPTPVFLGFPGGSVSKETACNAGNLGLIPGLGRSPGRDNGNPLQYSFWGNPMETGAWQATVHRVVQSQIWLKWPSTHIHIMSVISVTEWDNFR